MRIVVNDTAASYGGALTILKQFYNYIKNNDQTNEWIFILSDNYLEETENIKIVINSEVKKSGLHKIYFDCFSGRKYINDLKPDVVLSLQNIITFGVKAPQYTYIHQSIPYQDVKKFSFLKGNERGTAFIQYVIGAFINKSAKKADVVIVQTEWMKEAVAKKAKIDESKIIIAFPDVESFDVNREKYKAQNNKFFYPTNNAVYKNIDTIVNACNILNGKGVNDFKVYLTLPKGEIEHNNIECIGYLDREKMSEMYLTSTLLFPSYIETIGLPLLEAKDLNSLIFVADCPYAREVIGDYKNARFFETFESEQLAKLMNDRINNNIEITEIKPSKIIKKSEWENVYGLLINK